jgi:hypothetical protein
MSCEVRKHLKLLWYDNNELKESTLDLGYCSSWELLRNEVAHLTSFIPKKLRKLRFQNRDGFDLEEKFTESNFFDKDVFHNQEILLVDPENTNPLHGLISIPDLITCNCYGLVSIRSPFELMPH